jgi:uroporphyrinogen decarboxylase
LGQVVQGNLDNFLLAFGSKKEIEKQVLKILETLNHHPFIFNLGHGILPETPIENVEFLMKLIRN